MTTVTQVGPKTTPSVTANVPQKGRDGAVPLNVGNAPDALGEKRENQQQRIMTMRMNDFMRKLAAAESRLPLQNIATTGDRAR